MKLIIKSTLVLIFLLFATFTLTETGAINKVYAANCSFTVSPTTLTDRDMQFTVNLTDIQSKPSLALYFSNANKNVPIDTSVNNGTYTGTLNTIGWIGGANGQLTITAVWREAGRVGRTCDPAAGIIITVGTGSPTSGSCAISTNTASVGQEISVSTTGYSAPFNPRPISLVGTFAGNYSLGNLDFARTGYQLKKVNIPSVGDGLYQVIIDFGSPEQTSCGFIAIAGGGGIGPPGTNPCAGAQCCTALGCVSTDFKQFTAKILSIAIGIAGALALILMVRGSISVLTSQGDPQKVNNGREVIIAAVAGLLFLIFSVLILQFIGIKIFGGIPGIS